VAEVYRWIKELSGEVLVVSFAEPDKVTSHLQRDPLPFPVVSDPERRAYRAFELGRTSWRAILGLRSILRYLRHIGRGWWPRAAGSKTEDLMQLGGDFILDAQRRLIYSHPSKESTDRPTAAELLAVIRQSLAGNGQP
jgi:hypothetical protein